MKKKKEKNTEEVKDRPEKPKTKKAIVIEEKEEDILTTELKGDPENFKEEVRREAQKGRVARILIPIFFFMILGSAVGTATWHYQRVAREEEPKRVEDKIQTPPVVTEEDVPNEAPLETEVEEEAPTPTPSPPPVPQTPAPRTDYIEYTVKAGDTLDGIARANNLTFAELARYNNITNPEALLQIGQVLKIPRN